MKYTEPRMSNSALVIIDTQCDFVLPGAVAEIPGSWGVIPRMRSLLRAYRQAGRPVIHIVRLYKPDGSNVDLCRKERVEDGGRLIVPDSGGADIVADLKPEPDIQLDAAQLLDGGIQYWGKHEVVIYKPRWGAFYQTPLHRHLLSLGSDTLVFCGCNFPNCPRTSVYEASERDYRIVLVEDAVSGLYDRGIEELRAIGVRIWSADKVIETLRATPGA